MHRAGAQPWSEPTQRPAAQVPSEEFALTRRQTLFWLDEQLYPDVPYHHIVLRLTLSGTLDPARFRLAYAETLAAFDQFRLTFKTQGGEPRQRFSANLNCELALVDLTGTPEQLDDWLIERARRRFDFARALFDAALIRLAPDQHVFYFCQHHVISDGASVGLFLEELAQRYRGLTPPPRPSFALYLCSEKSYRESPRARRDQAHFEQRLSGGMPPLALYGRTRVSRSFGVDRSQLALGAERSAAFARVSRDARVELLDPAMSRLVALATLVLAFVYRVGGARKLVLALPVPNRSAEHAQLGGLLMEQTFLRVDVDDGESFATLADKVRRELFASLRHARHSLSDRGLSYVTLNLLRMPTPDFGPPADSRASTFGALRARVELTPLSCSPRLEGAGQGDLRDTFGVHVIGFDERAPLTIGFDFHRETFDAALQGRARRHFLALCDALLEDLDRTLDAVELCDEGERAQLLALGRGPEPASPAPDALAQIAEVAGRRPGHPALRSLGKTLNYSELLSAAGKLAARLAQEGIGRGERVAFCTPRGADEPLSMLAAWIVGAAYVPLDPSHPRERTKLILEDAKPRLVLTHSTLSHRLPSGHSLLLLDREREAIDALAPLPFAAPADPEDIAYVLFTSGSTGRPKGVEIPRRAIANFLRAMARSPGLGPSDRLLAVTTPTFDIAALELLLPLCVGALVQIADRETVLDPYLLRETLERDGITVLQATPTTFRLLLEAGLGRRPQQLKLLCGGEAISRALADQLLATGAELWNMYGPTETTVWSTHARLRAGAGPISIGTPIDATQVYVLSANGALQPFGVSGELCIGGAGLARGYLGRPELSAERFIQNPQGPHGDLVYRSGDLARYLPSGELQCLGRLDHQVKVRGFRIELGEIEACLRQRPELREVVVHALATDEEPRLVAYYVAEQDCEEVLRATAHRHLPSYMQPAAYVRLDALPLNSNGKVDRAALPAPTVARAQHGPAQSCESPAEQRMADLFQEVLGRDGVPLDRDFFTLGGDSVRAMQLRRRINETFQVELPLSVLFDAPSVRSLVSALRKSDVRPSPLFLQLRPGLREAAPLICVMGIALYRDLALALDTDRAVYGVHVPLGMRSGISAPSVQEIARRYTELILERVPRGPYHLAGLCFGGLVAFEVAHQLLRRGHELGTLAVFDGLLPRGMRYRPLAHARALLAQPARIPQRLRARGERFVRQLRGTSSAADELDLNLQGSQAARLARSYDAHARQLSRPFLLFRATEREEAPWYRVDARLGWGQLGAPVTVHSVPGSHLSILQAGNVRALAEVLSRQLADEPTRVSRPPLL